MVVEKLVEDTESPDYINPDYLKFQSGGYLELGIPTIKQNCSVVSYCLMIKPLCDTWTEYLAGRFGYE